MIVVRLNRIYTRTGDAGETGLGDGTRVPKTDVRIEAYGTVDELNSVLALCVDQVSDSDLAARLAQLQNDLFDLGADLCVPDAGGESVSQPLRVTAAQVSHLEAWIDAVNEPLPELKSFILPGGTPLASALHVARTVCRRAERRVVALLAVDATVNEHVLTYLNRMSDLFFVLARAEAGADAPLWKPGGGEDTQA
jgi:cob(I)alamin adenosyltransferase